MQKTSPLNIIQKAGAKLGHPAIAFFILIWLMVILVAGTVAQKYAGLYVAEKTFFSSYIIWAGIVPLPGGYLTIGMLAVSLIAKLVFLSPWRKNRIGTITSHFAVLLLLAGGLLTAYYSDEGSMIIYEGSSSNFVSDYHKRELVVYNQQEGKPEQILTRWSWEDIADGKEFTSENVPFSIEVVKHCRNCSLFLRGKEMDFQPAPLHPEDEQNKSGVLFTVSGSGIDQDGEYMSFDFLPVHPRIIVGGKAYSVALRKEKRILPFAVKLEKFEKEMHPSTDIARSYASDVTILDGDIKWHARISMNEPLRYKGYTLYQSSFIESDGNNATVLAVVKNYGRIFPYLSGGLLAVGLMIHLVQRLLSYKTRKALLIAAAMLVFWPLPSIASNLDIESFSKLPVQHEGRIKPLDSLARSSLKLIHGAPTLPDMSAGEWLAETVFAPDKARKRRIFKAASREVMNALNLPPSESRLYTYDEVFAALEKHKEMLSSLLTIPLNELSLSQEQTINFYDAARIFNDITNSLNFIAPQFAIQDATLASKLGIKKGERFNYLQIRKKRETVKQLAAKKNNEASRILKQINLLEAMEGGKLLAVAPPQWPDSDGEWLSLWGVTFSGKGSPQSAKLIQQWKAMLEAYNEGDEKAWNTAVSEANSMLGRMPHNNASAKKLQVELWMNKYSPINIALLLYCISLVAGLGSFSGTYKRNAHKCSIFLLALALVFHATSLIARMYIMGRPPVTNLYESIIFVSFAAAAWGAFQEYRKQSGYWILISSMIGAFLLFIASGYEMHGDTMKVLSAVLDTNFWLATHVVAITIGYAATILSATIAHFCLARLAFTQTTMQDNTLLTRGMHSATLAALLFTALGTILGGIWADQSWGRFWGWDPKENGALLIVLWLLWIIHGRLGGLFGHLATIMATAASGIIVSLAWFGVNLLNVGLHSYGFTRHVALNLGLFISAEILIIFIAGILIHLRNNRRHFT